ncbi:hypothetical protein C7R82_13140 [Escherichia coli]|nr:hypothetical protein [Escherichia coli]MDN1332938.1 hypothetical protein [Escherichia coli]MDN1499767.1 hypothetical protein [Escherichia coli]MDN1734546.1 hypothetical protein [Escherichia coli]MDN1754645.1 hypothetical protein [Escherichia coli]
MSCRSAPPADQWQKCHLRADLMPGPAAVRRLLQYAVLPAVRIPLYSITDWHRSPISDSHPFDQPGT